MTPKGREQRRISAARWRKENPVKAKAYWRAWYARNKEKRKAIQRANYTSAQGWATYAKNKKRDPDFVRRINLLSKYGITLKQYDVLFAKQKGQCAICGQGPNRKNFAVDHDHKTGDVRGLLCDPCNYGLGNFKDDKKLLEKAKRYLK
jgi:hypothetical protein